MTFSAVIENLGNGTAQNFTVRFLLDGNLNLGDRVVANLTAGANATVASDAWNATAEGHTIKVIADANGNVEESNETNNERAESFTVAAPPPPPQPDLVVLDITLSPSSPVPGGNVTFTATVKNQGNASAGGFRTRFVVDNVSIGEPYVGGLAAGATANVSAWWNATPGNHTIRAIADVYAQVNESNESNNERAESFSVASPPPPALPDLVVVDIVWSPAAPVAGQNVTFTATIRNQGDGSAGSFWVRLLVDDRSTGERIVGGLAPGAAVNVSTSWNATSGNHTIRAIADVYGQVSESNEGNNEKAEGFAVAADPAPRVVIYRFAIDLDFASQHEGSDLLSLHGTYRAVEATASCVSSSGSLFMERVDAGGPGVEVACTPARVVSSTPAVLPPGSYGVAYSAAGSGWFVIEVTGIAE